MRVRARFSKPTRRGVPVLMKLKSSLGGGLKCIDPEQHYAIGFASNGSLITLIYEFRYDEEGAYIWLVTLWKSTKEEKKRVGL
jgi:hypothetical protein